MQLETFGEYPLFFALIVNTSRLAEGNDVMDVDEYAECHANGEDVDLTQSFSGKKQMIYHKYTNGAVFDIINYGYVNGQAHIEH